MKQEILRKMTVGFNTNVNSYGNPLNAVLQKERNETLLTLLKTLSGHELALL
jgi:hypothetical protein